MDEMIFNKKQLWQSRLDACQKSGMSAKQWCAQNHIAYSTYFYWAKKSKTISDPKKGNLSGEMVFAQLPSERDILTRPQEIPAPVSMFLGSIRIDVTSSCPQTLLQALIGVLMQYA